MNKQTIIAKSKDGVELGRRDIEVATTMDELKDQFEGKDIIALVYRSHIIDIQRELRAKAMEGSPTANAQVNLMKTKALADKAAGDSKLYDALIATGILKADEASIN